MTPQHKKLFCFIAFVAVLVSAGSVYALRHAITAEWYIVQLNSDDLEERQKAIAKLGELRSTRAVPHLIELWRRYGERNPSSCADALMAIGPPAVTPLLRLAAERSLHELNVADIVGRMALGVVPVLTRALDDQDRRVRDVTVLTLERMGSRVEFGAAITSEFPVRAGEAIAALLPVLGNSEAHREAWHALLVIARTAPHARTYLVRFAESEDSLVRAGGASLLGQLGSTSKRTLDCLRRLLNDEVASVRTQAAFELVRIRPERFQSLQDKAVTILLRAVESDASIAIFDRHPVLESDDPWDYHLPGELADLFGSEPSLLSAAAADAKTPELRRLAESLSQFLGYEDDLEDAPLDEVDVAE